MQSTYVCNLAVHAVAARKFPRSTFSAVFCNTRNEGLKGMSMGESNREFGEVGQMIRMNKIACSMFLIVVGIAPAMATTNATTPRSLEIRSRTSHGVQPRLGKRVGQA